MATKSAPEAAKWLSKRAEESKRVAGNSWKYPEVSKTDVKSLSGVDKCFLRDSVGKHLGSDLASICGPLARSPTRTKA